MNKIRYLFLTTDMFKEQKITEQCKKKNIVFEYMLNYMDIFIENPLHSLVDVQRYHFKSITITTFV